MTDGWVAFLNARLDEDEAAAKAAGGDSWRASESGVYHEDVANFPGPFAVGPYEYLEDGERAHIGRHDPARVLREVQAKRAILADYLKAADDLEDPWVTNALLTALGHHMAVWDDHPDYPAARKSLKEAYWTP